MSGTRGFGRIVVWGIGLAVALLLLVAGEAKAGKYQVAQCGWYVGADAGWADSTGGAKFRPDSWCVPPAGQDPFDGVHLKSFTREGQSHCLRHPLRPLALGGARRHRHLPGQRHLVARAARRHGAPPRRRHLEWRLRRLRPLPPAPTPPLRPFVAGFNPGPARLRGPPALRQGGEQLVQPQLAVLGRGPRPHDHYSGRPRPRTGHRRRRPRRRLAARQPERRLLGRRQRWRHPLRRDLRRWRPRQPHRVSLREGVHRRRVAGDADAPLSVERLGRGDDRHEQPQRRPAQRRPLRHRLRRQRRLHSQPHLLLWTTTRRPIRAN